MTLDSRESTGHDHGTGSGVKVECIGRLRGYSAYDLGIVSAQTFHSLPMVFKMQKAQLETSLFQQAIVMEDERKKIWEEALETIPPPAHDKTVWGPLDGAQAPDWRGPGGDGGSGSDF